MTKGHILFGVSDEPRLKEYLRGKVGESEYTQMQLGRLIGRHQTWISSYLLSAPVSTVRSLFLKAPDVLERVIEHLKLDRARLYWLAGIYTDDAFAEEVPLRRKILVFPTRAGPSLQPSDAVDSVRVSEHDADDREVIGLRVSGDSMAPYLEDGETAIIALDPSAVKPGMKVGAYIHGVGNVVRVFVRLEASGEYLLQALNAGDGEQAYFQAPPDSKLYGPVINVIKRG